MGFVRKKMKDLVEFLATVLWVYRQIAIPCLIVYLLYRPLCVSVYQSVSQWVKMPLLGQNTLQKMVYSKSSKQRFSRSNIFMTLLRCVWSYAVIPEIWCLLFGHTTVLVTVMFCSISKVVCYVCIWLWTTVCYYYRIFTVTYCRSIMFEYFCSIFLLKKTNLCRFYV